MEDGAAYTGDVDWRYAGLPDHAEDIHPHQRGGCGSFMSHQHLCDFAAAGQPPEVHRLLDDAHLVQSDLLPVC